MRTTTQLLIVSLILPAGARAQRSDDLRKAPQLTMTELSGRTIKVSKVAIRTAPAVSDPGETACHTEWKCVVGGAAVGFLAGALIGHAVGPKPVEHRVSGYGFFGNYSYMQCDTHCDDGDKYTVPVGIGGPL